MNNKLYEKCIRCGRKLSNTESMKIGYGIICATKAKYSKQKPIFDVNFKKEN